jgi:hypothetical protein
VREGRGQTGGKTIVFERLFKVRERCGYNFGRNTSEIIIKEKVLFESFVHAIVAYLIANPDTSSRTIDIEGPESFLNRLKPFGFPPKKPSPSDSDDSMSDSTDQSDTDNGEDTDRSSGSNSNKGDSNNSSGKSNGNGRNRFSTKSKPSLKRKKIPNSLLKLINECYNLDENNFASAKTALTRVVLECVMKYVVENSFKSNGKALSTSNHFQLAFKDRQGRELPYTNFSNLKAKFTELIKDTGIRNSFNVFDLDLPNQIIHNYRVGAIPKQAKDICDNLIDLIEFMLQEETDLLNSLDLSKL